MSSRLGSAWQRHYRTKRIVQCWDKSDCLQAYAQKIGECLSKVQHHGQIPAFIGELQKWTCQCGCLRVFLAMGNWKKFLAFSSSRLDGQVGPCSSDLSDDWYQRILVSSKTTSRQHLSHILKCCHMTLANKTAKACTATRILPLQQLSMFAWYIWNATSSHQYSCADKGAALVFKDPLVLPCLCFVKIGHYAVLLACGCFWDGRC